MNRNIKIDFLKALLISCVLLSHSISMLLMLVDRTWVDSPINVCFTTFEMPLFTVISGYFAYNSLHKNSYGKFIKKRAFTSLPPLIILSYVPTIVKKLFFDKSISNLEEFFITSYESIFNGKLWFLSLYFLCSVTIVLFDLILFKTKKYLKITLTVLLAMLFTPFIVYDNFLSHFGFLFPFFLLGYLLNKFKFFEKKYRIIIYFISIMFIPMIYFYKSEYSFYILDSSKLINDVKIMGIIIFRFFLSVFSCSLVYTLVHFFYKIKTPMVIDKTLSYIGQKTMAIYILSMYIQDVLFKIFQHLLINNYLENYVIILLWSCVFLVLLMFFSLLIDFLLGKLKFIHKLLLE